MAVSRTVTDENGKTVPRKRVKSSALTEHGIERLGKTLKEKRDDLGMTQEEFVVWIERESDRLGIPGVRLSVGAIQNWELPRIASCPDLGNMRVLAAVFGLDTDSFVTGDLGLKPRPLAKRRTAFLPVYRSSPQLIESWSFFSVAPLSVVSLVARTLFGY
jgi:transcriptional regulator with XRE-family HTH domain